MVSISRDEKGGTKILFAIELAEDVSYGRNIDFVDRTTMETLLGMLMVGQTDMKPVKLLVELPPMRRVGCASDFGV